MRRLTTAAALISLFATPSAFAQGFSSTSNGSDGALSFAPMAGTINFDPVALGLDGDGDGVYHFTTIDIPAGTTVLLRTDAPRLSEGIPIYWLATGTVSIAGTLSVRGQGGHDSDLLPRPALPGPGGFGGGAGGTPADNTPIPGSGPGGGATGDTLSGGNGSHRLVGQVISGYAAPGPGYGNRFMMPLLGGSGGGGASAVSANTGTGGGAGGGAILIASSVSIDLTGTIDARGGDAGINRGARFGGRGAGGAVRLMAPRLTGDGTVDTRNGGNSATVGAGWARFEGFFVSNDLVSNPSGSVSIVSPNLIFPPADAPTVRITMIGGVSVAASPTGSFVMPDAVINAGTPVSLVIAATNIPAGTQVTLRLVPENGMGMTLLSDALAGSLASSTANAGPFTVPSGFSRFYISATWGP